MKKLLSLLTVLVMTCTVIAGIMPVGAEESPIATEPTIENEITVEGTNSFGNLLSEKLENKAAEQQSNNGCNVYSAEVTDNEVSVNFETTQYCTLLAAVYTEDGVQMLASGTAEVTPEETEKTVTIETDTMPEYFYLKVFLVDTNTLRPICTAYESPNYTQEMQEFFAKTVDDFDSERVLNFDENLSNNFAVFSEETIIVPSDENTNKVSSLDEENEIYVIENADKTVTSLENGDIFSLESEDGNLLIVKVDKVTVDGTTATITGQDTEMEEVFEYIKIDASQNSDQAEVDSSELEEGIIYNGLVDDTEQDSGTSAYSTKSGYISSRPKAFVDEEFEKSAELSFEFDDYEPAEMNAGNGNVSVEVSAEISGTLNLSIGCSMKLYISFSHSYLEVNFNTALGVNVSIEGKIAAEIKLATIQFTIIPGVNIDIEPAFVVEVSAKISLNIEVSSSVGFNVDTEKGLTVVKPKPEYSSDLKIEGVIFVGLSLKPGINIICDNVAEVEFEAKIGIELQGERELVSVNLSDVNPDDEFHDCSCCISGGLHRVAEMSINVKLLDSDDLTFTYTISSTRNYIGDFYYSITYKDFGFGSCPHMKYKTTILVKDAHGHPVSNADILFNNLITDNKFKTNSLGNAKTYLQSGTYTIKVSSNGQTAYKQIKIEDEAKIITVILTSLTSDTDNNNDNTTDETTSLPMLSLGDIHSAYIDENGNLYMWGSNKYGQLGNGKTEDSLTPVKIMENVKSVSLGSGHSAAITKDGNLYMWGRNDYGQLGNSNRNNSSEPIKIMENVKSVSLESLYSTAITETGSLYTWGNGEYGQLGNGSPEPCLKPKSIMDNVISVSLTSKNIAVVTEDGTLYMSGNNLSGQLGNGDTTMTLLPIKVMDNVKEVCLSSYNSGAVTADGSLYMWGLNDFRSITAEKSGPVLEPLKIMDNVKTLSLGSAHSSALTEDGTLYMWGRNDRSQFTGSTDSSVPTPVMDNIKFASLDDQRSLIITENNDLYIMGHNYYGSLGNGFIISSPEAVLKNVTNAVFGDSHIGALTSDGSIYMCGLNEYGQLGNGTTENSSVPVKIEIPSELTAETKTLTTSYSAMTLAADETEVTKQFSDLLPNEVYNLYAFKSNEAESMLSSDNLLYVNQAVSDENGNITVPCVLKEEYADAVFFEKAMSKTDISSAEVTIADMPYNGEEQFAEPVVTLNGTKLVQGEHYDIEGDYSAVDYGTYEITVVGIDEYTGEVTASYSITCEHEFTDGICDICGSECEHSYKDGVCTECGTKNTEQLTGDANNDGKVNVRDAAFIAAALAKGQTDTLPAHADFNEDEKVNVRDAAAIASALAKGEL